MSNFLELSSKLKFIITELPQTQKNKFCVYFLQELLIYTNSYTDIDG